MSEKTVLDVRGMTCSSCASGISRHLEKLGLHDVNVHFDSGEVEVMEYGSVMQGNRQVGLHQQFKGGGFESRQMGIADDFARIPIFNQYRFQHPLAFAHGLSMDNSA
jgi:copper chaperone CopZ